MERMLRTSLTGVTVIVFLLLASGMQAQQAQPTEPFGFKAGMTKAEVIASVEAKSVTEDDGDFIFLSTAPKTYADLDLYRIFISPTRGVAEVEGISKNVETNSFGDQLKEQFKEFKTALESKYGVPSYGFDFVQTGSKWHERADWMMGLLKRERRLETYWDVQPSQILVSLKTLALSPDKGEIVISYQFANFASCVKEHDAKNNSAW